MGRRGSGPQYEQAVREEFEPMLARLTGSGEVDGWLKPQAVYGFFPVQSLGNDLSSTIPTRTRRTARRARSRASISRARKDASVCVSPTISAVGFVATSTSSRFQVVTVGDDADETLPGAAERGRIHRAFYVHGLAVETAEARRGVDASAAATGAGRPGRRGKRYSWGYGACPDLEDHAQLFKLLPAEESSAWS